MQITRQLNYSLMYFLMEELSVGVDTITLTSNDGKEYKIPHSNLVVTKPIEIFIDGQKANKEEYKVYPLLGDVIFNEKIEDKEVTASYRYSVVNVLGHTEGDLISPPLLAIENSGDNDYAYELGSSLSDVEVLLYIHLYGANQAQRDDLCDMVKRPLQKELKIYNYSNGFPLASDGSLRDVEFPVVNSATFPRVSVNRNPLESVDEIEVGRALVTVTCRYVN